MTLEDTHSLPKKTDDALSPSSTLSSKYKKFVITGFTRVGIARIISLAYILVVVRLIAPKVLDSMVVLSSGLIMLPSFFSFGLRYSSQRQAIKLDNKEEIITSSNFFLLTVSFVLSCFGAIPLFYFSVPNPSLINLFLYFGALFFTYFRQVQINVFRVYLFEDKILIQALIYSILNSFLVPLFYWYDQSLTSVLFAWNLGMLLSIIPYLKPILPFLKINFFSLNVLSRTFKFGLILYIFAFPNYFLNHMDSLIVYLILPSGSTSIYYYLNRFLLVITEVVLVLQIGIFPLFAQLEKNSGKERLAKAFQSGFRLYLVASIIPMFMIIINSELIVYVLLGTDNYSSQILDQTVYLVYFLALGAIFINLMTYLTKLKFAQGKQADIGIAATILAIFKIGIFVLLEDLELIGLGWGVMTAAFLSFLFLYFITPELYNISKKSLLGLILYFFTLLGISFGMVLLDLGLPSFWRFILINSVFLITAIGGLIVFRPFNKDDITFLRNVIPKRTQFVIDRYERFLN